MADTRRRAGSALGAVCVAATFCTPPPAGGTQLGADPHLDACEVWLTMRGWPPPDDAPVFHTLNDGAGCLDGHLIRANAGELLDWSMRPPAEGEVKTLVVRSRGGEADLGIELAGNLQAYDARVWVVHVCASSCANYLYAGLADRRVADRALVIFHGGYSDTVRTGIEDSLDAALDGHDGALSDRDAAIGRAMADFDRNRAEQDALLDGAGVDAAVIHGLDGLDFTTLAAETCAGPQDAPRRFVFFDADQAEAMGLSPRAGRVLDTPDEIAAAIAALDTPARICRAPDSIFPG